VRPFLYLDPALRTIAGFRNWFEKRLDDAIQVEEQKKSENGNAGKKERRTLPVLWTL
jgi:hypothetical protein